MEKSKSRLLLSDRLLSLGIRERNKGWKPSKDFLAIYDEYLRLINIEANGKTVSLEDVEKFIISIRDSKVWNWEEKDRLNNLLNYWCGKRFQGSDKKLNYEDYRLKYKD